MTTTSKTTSQTPSVRSHTSIGQTEVEVSIRGKLIKDGWNKEWMHHWCTFYPGKNTFVLNSAHVTGVVAVEHYLSIFMPVSGVIADAPEWALSAAREKGLI